VCRTVEQDLTISLNHSSVEVQPDSENVGLDSFSGVGLAPSSARSFKPIDLLKRAFSFPAMLSALLVSGVFWAKHGFDVDTDFWWHLKVGEDLLATHRWPTTDPYSFTAPGHPWIAAEWLGDVLFASVERAGGLPALDGLLITLSAITILALHSLCILRTKNSKASFLASAIVTILAIPVFNFRPQMIGLLFLILTLIALELFRHGKPAALWFLPVVFLIWMNTHGSWILGFVVLLAYWVSGLKEISFGSVEMRAWRQDQRRRLSLIFLLCVAVLPITPYGTELAPYPFVVSSSFPVNLASINEWQPMPFNLFGAKLFLALIFLFFAAQLVYRATWKFEDLALFFLGTVMACLHVRFILVFIPFFAPIFATLLARWVPRYEREKDRYWINAILMATLLTAMIHYFPSKAEIENNISRNYPSGAVEYMRTHPMPDRILNSYGFGGYLIWSGARTKIFIDGRGELYEIAGVFADFMHIGLLKPGALSVLRNYQVQACLLDRGAPLAVFLTALPEWKTVYSDNVSTLLVRQEVALGPAYNLTASEKPSEPVLEVPRKQ
jgi:hypothetical protein